MAENGCDDPDSDKQELLQKSVYSSVQEVARRLLSQKKELAEYTDLQQQLESSERERDSLKQELVRSQKQIQEIRQKEAGNDILLAQPQQQIQEVEEQETELSKAKNKELVQQRQKQNEQLQLSSGPQTAKEKDVSQYYSNSIGKLSIVRRCKEPLPQTMARGSATTDHDFAYFAPAGSTSLYQYAWNREKWRLLPTRLRYLNSALVIVDGELTTVGGVDRRFCRTNSLLTLQQEEWAEKYPSMKRQRSSPAVVCTPGGHCCVVVAGGLGICGVRSRSVELLQVDTTSWYTLTDLPKPFPRPSATICGDELYIIDDIDGYSCSLGDLVSSQKPIVPTLSWKPLPPLPVKDVTCAALCGQLVVVGGFQCMDSPENQNPDIDGIFLRMPSCFLPNSSISQLVGGEWAEIGSLSIARRDCFAVTPLPDKMLVVGGWKEHSVEECFVIQ